MAEEDNNSIPTWAKVAGGVAVVGGIAYIISRGVEGSKDEAPASTAPAPAPAAPAPAPAPAAPAKKAVVDKSKLSPEQIANLTKARKDHPKIAGKKFKYGTAGFRMNADLLDSVMMQVGVLAALRSKSTAGLTTGVVVTASHNMEVDNGAKIADPTGEMMKETWEAYASMLANAETDEEYFRELHAIAAAEKIDFTVPATVFLGRDTRKHSLALSKAVECGIKALGGAVSDFGLATTPQLHQYVRSANNNESFGEKAYYDKVEQAFMKIVKSDGTVKAGGKLQPLTIDCANGVGAGKMIDLVERLKDTLPITLINTGDGELNKGSGAEFVQKEKSLPAGVTVAEHTGLKFCSYDGDADRIVYFFINKEGTMKLLDGDRQIALCAIFFAEQLAKAGITDLNIGTVQTAYANGASTKYIKEELKVPCFYAKTGVKYLHHKAVDFDIGIYYEANGHGTVIFKPSALKKIKATQCTTPEANTAKEMILAMSELAHQAVGDAIGDMLMIEAILALKGWTLDDWDALYTDLPSKMDKVIVSDRTQITTNDDETQCLTPAGLQAKVDEAVKKYPGGRSFVRPSGTEDIVRVFAEANSPNDSDALAWEVMQLTFDNAGGTGSRPDPQKV